VNSRLEKLVERIIEHSETPPVIVIQADHGSGFIHDFNLYLDRPPCDEFLRKQMCIFSAFHLPGKGQDRVYDWITPVNTFRVIFNRCFKAGIPLLEDMHISRGLQDGGLDCSIICFLCGCRLALSIRL